MPIASRKIDYSSSEDWSDYSHDNTSTSVDNSPVVSHPFRHNQDKQPKERIRRTGKIPLNLTSEFGLNSGWGMKEGFRELIQNLYKHSFQSCF